MDFLKEGLKQICLADKTAALFIEPRIAEITELLVRYVNETERFNSVYGLVKADNRDTLIVKHILDSIAPLGHIIELFGRDATRDGCKGFPAKIAADIGSGAGLPGIPLAICLPHLCITLIERMGRRAGFLRNTCAVLAAMPGGLKNILVDETELEKARGSFDLIVFRALSSLTPDFTAKLFRLCKPGGIIAAYKGKHDTAKAELAGLSRQLFTTELIPVTVPFLDEERCLAAIKS